MNDIRGDLDYPENFDQGKRNLVRVSKEFDPAVTVQSEVTN